ncbi:ATP-binding protein [Streptomyces sp. NPDC052676]|uniref:ATP-binding protein n=1 Tax=Streptomyces sp. NPDC052676 TaxID=3154953 RepID=UPI00342D1749
MTTIRKGSVHCTNRGFAVAFAPEKTRVSQMRKVVTAHMALWGVRGKLTDNVVSAVSELVTNAIQHGKGDVGLRVQCVDTELRIEVTDGNPAPAELHIADADDESGRGLFLVSRLARNWGVSEDGMTTWCTFHIPSRRS